MARQIKPFFSIIIPALNEGKYLPNLLKDLALQTFTNFEVLVVDGRSTDNTVEKALSFVSSLPHLTILQSQKRHVCIQRNLGADQARADWLLFMDADNRLPVNFLEGIKSQCLKHNVDILTSWLKPDIETSTNLTYSTIMNIFLELQMNYTPTFLLEAFFAIKKNVFLKIGKFDETVSYAEGKTLIKKAALLGFKAKMVREPIWTYSFRRIRKYGHLGAATRVLQLELMDLLGLDKAHNLANLYPMKGGKYFDTPKRKKLLRTIEKLLKSESARKKFIASYKSKLKTFLNT